jgi:hypothetical protein
MSESKSILGDRQFSCVETYMFLELSQFACWENQRPVKRGPHKAQANYEK